MSADQRRSLIRLHPPPPQSQEIVQARSISPLTPGLHQSNFLMPSMIHLLLLFFFPHVSLCFITKKCSSTQF